MWPCQIFHLTQCRDQKSSDNHNKTAQRYKKDLKQQCFHAKFIEVWYLYFWQQLIHGQIRGKFTANLRQIYVSPQALYCAQGAKFFFNVNARELSVNLSVNIFYSSFLSLYVFDLHFVILTFFGHYGHSGEQSSE